MKSALLIIALLVINAPVFAKSLTEQNITSFIEYTTELTSGSVDNDLSPDKVIKYLEKHIEEDARFKTLMRFEIPGQPPQESMMRMGKEEFIDKVEKSTDQIQDYESDITVMEIKISRNKRSATVRTRNTETAIVPVQNSAGGFNNVPMDGISFCTQILRLSKDDIIQMYNASCITDVAFTSFGND